MTKQEAIYLLNNLRAFAEEDDDPAIDMAIEALKKQPVYEQVKWERDTALQTLEEHGIGLGERKVDAPTDFIPRQAAINAIENTDAEITAEEWDELANAIKSLPSAEPEQTKMIKEIRKWINSGHRGSADYFIVDKIEEIINKYE